LTKDIVNEAYSELARNISDSPWIDRDSELPREKTLVYVRIEGFLTYDPTNAAQSWQAIEGVKLSITQYKTIDAQHINRTIKTAPERKPDVEVAEPHAKVRD
jgi:hypothetical protein